MTIILTLLPTNVRNVRDKEPVQHQHTKCSNQKHGRIIGASSSLSSQFVCVPISCSQRKFHARSRGADVVETSPSSLSSSSSRTCTHFVCGRLSAQRNGDDGVGFGVAVLVVVWGLLLSWFGRCAIIICYGCSRIIENNLYGIVTRACAFVFY